MTTHKLSKLANKFQKKLGGEFSSGDGGGDYEPPDAVCGKCYGEGSQVSLDEYERARGIEDTCYHCSGTGRIEPGQAEEDKRLGLIEELAYEQIMKERDDRNNDEEGEGWTFAAAENMMSERDYTMARIMDREGQLIEALRGKKFSTLKELKEVFSSLPSGWWYK